MNHIQAYNSHLDPTFEVLIVYPESSLYSTVNEHFKIAGHAFLVHDKKMIIIDGATVEEQWFTKDHLMVIEAHEIGHHIAEHSVTNRVKPGPKMELEADWIGYQILKESGHLSAAKLHRAEYKSRYGKYPPSRSRFKYLAKKMAENKNIRAN